MSATATESDTQALYRFFDEAGELLYVGISLYPLQRWNQHRLDKPWWGDIRTATIEAHPSREAVEAAELAAIESEQPRYNIHRGTMIQKTYRAPAPLYAEAKDLAVERQENLSDVIRRALEAYVQEES